MPENNDLILEELRKNNPFRSRISPTPFENTNPDIQQLNRDVSEEIEQLLRDKRRRPSEPAAGLIIGETGSGKTHMLTRLLRRMKSYGWPAIFVSVRTFRNPDSVMHDLLSEIFISLAHKNFSKRSQFDMLLSEMMSIYSERRKIDGFTGIDKIDTKIYLMRDMPGIDRVFLRCLMSYLRAADETEKLYLLEWLREGLDEDDSLRFGLPARDTSSMNNAERENDAEKIIISIGRVLGYAKVPMIICFDELDAMPRETELIHAWGRVISLLVNNVSGVLPLAFMKPETWNEVFFPVLDHAVTHRLGNTIIMHPCSTEQAQQLVRERLKSAFPHNSKEELDEKYNWLMKRLEPKLTKGTSPRNVLKLADSVITQGDNIPRVEKNEIDNTIRNTYDEIYSKIEAEASSWPPNADHLTLALEVWLKSHEGFELSQGDGKTVKFLGSYSGKKFMFIIAASKSHFVISAGLKHGISFLNAYPEGLCFYISERKLFKKTYKQANNYLREFESLGGKAVLLDEESRVSWYAFMDLINQIDGGNVSIFTSSGNKQASREDLRELAGSLRLLDIDFKKSGHTAKNPPVNHNVNLDFDEKNLMRELMKILDTSPMKLLAIDKTLNILAQRGIFVESEKFLSFAKNHREDFRIFQTKTETLIGLTEK